MKKNHDLCVPNLKDDVSSPLSAQILEFCDPDFLETLQTSEVTSSSNYCYDENSPYATNLLLPPDTDNKIKNSRDNNSCNTTTSTTTPTTTSSATTAAANPNNNMSTLSMIFDPHDELDNEISASIDFSMPQFITTTNQLQDNHHQFDFSSVQPHHQLSVSLTDLVSADGLTLTQYPSDNSGAPIMIGPPLPSVFEEDCLSSVPSYVALNPSSPSCSFLGPAGLSSYMSNSGLSADSSAIFGSGVLLGSDLQPPELEYQGDNAGIFCPDSMARVFNTGDLQSLSNETQQFVSGTGNSTTLTSEMSSLEDSAFKVGKLSVEQRKEKIHRYMKKRNERNFSKKIKYACRKTLADSRPRVRGRFAKNDDFGETNRAACSNHEEEDDDGIIVKEEEEMVDSSDIFAHISGVNSFKCNYSIQSWI
ncbi:uncharacterized protein LOC126670794 isoform X2 [Mercurialis annua]|uniref:uncharacterized protein LOC126670794 isoform X2 n=1 Tax=Mercurialis annua TaxID=3986 RepID=UPI00215E2440|nr:uncharacterized protein LOC126670794 isoform X2 [Mercurialis annua]